jgi:hypothetical protein
MPMPYQKKLKSIREGDAAQEGRKETQAARGALRSGAGGSRRRPSASRRGKGSEFAKGSFVCIGVDSDRRIYKCKKKILIATRIYSG